MPDFLRKRRSHPEPRVDIFQHCSTVLRSAVCAAVVSGAANGTITTTTLEGKQCSYMSDGHKDF